MPYSLGLICHGWHESAAVLVQDGRVAAAAEEERFTRKKFDHAFPQNAIRYCLEAAGIEASDLDAAGFGFAPARRLGAKLGYAIRQFPGSVHLFRTRAPLARRMLDVSTELREVIGYDGPLVNFNHHVCHAASAFYSSPFDRAAILSIDGVGDWEAAWWGSGDGTSIRQRGSVDWPRSLGHIYAAFTEYLGFQPFSDEYKVMGLAPYGTPKYLDRVRRMFWSTAKGYDVDLNYFAFPHGKRPRYGARVVREFGPPLQPNTEDPPQHYRDVAASVQRQLEDVVLHLARIAVDAAGERKLCLAGGVAMNSVANGRIIREGIADELYVPPCASDAGVALGAAYLAQMQNGFGARPSMLDSALLGPSYDDDRIRLALDAAGLPYDRVSNAAEAAADLVAGGKVIAWFQGRMEFGQRALGARSIIADPRQASMKELINAKVKFREPFRPFAPSVLEECASDYFDTRQRVPFMTEVYPVREEKKGVIPAVTHVDGSARIQTVSRTANPLYWQLIDAFRKRTGVAVVLNTSFNIKGQPIVNTPEEAIDTFLRTDIDALVAGSFVARKPLR